MPDPNEFQHPVATTNRIDPSRLTGNPLVDKALVGLSGVDPSRLPPPLIPGYTPVDIQRMHSFGTPARSYHDELFLQMSDPVIKGMLNSNDPTIKALREQYSGSALQQQVAMSPSLHYLTGGNFYGGFQSMMNASEYQARGMLPMNNDMYVKSRWNAMVQMSALGNTMMADIYGDGVTPNLAVTKGFRAEDPFLMAGQLAARDRFIVNDPGVPGGRRRTSDPREMQRIVSDNLETMAAGRNVFGDMPAMDMLANVERMMGADPTSNPPEFKRRLTKFAALANAVGENAKSLAEVNQMMLDGVSGGLGGGGGGMGGRSIGGIMGSMGGTIPMTGRGTSVGGWVEAAAMTATTEYAQVVAGRRLIGGDLTDAGRTDIAMGVMANQQRREASGIGRASRMIRMLEANNQVSPEMVVRYEEAQQSGDRFAVNRVLRDISTDLYQDPDMLTRAIKNEAVYNDTISSLALEAGPGRTMRAQEAAARDVRSIEKGEMVERSTRDRAQRSHRATMKTLRAAGINPNMKAADEAAYTAMQQALEKGGGTLQGISREDREMMAEQLETWRTSGEGMSTKQILGAMRESELFKDLPGSEQLALVAAEGANINLAGQAIAADKAGVLSIMPAAREVFHSAGKSRLADAAEAEVKKLVKAGRYEEAKERMNRFIDSDSGWSPEMKANMKKRLTAMETRQTRRVATLEMGGAAAGFERGPYAGMDRAKRLATFGNVQARGVLQESIRADEMGVSDALESTTSAPRIGPGGEIMVGDAYREAAEANVRVRQQPDAGQIAVESIVKKGKEAVEKKSTKKDGTPDGSSEPIKVVVVGVQPADLLRGPPQVGGPTVRGPSYSEYRGGGI